MQSDRKRGLSPLPNEGLLEWTLAFMALQGESTIVDTSL